MTQDEFNKLMEEYERTHMSNTEIMVNFFMVCAALTFIALSLGEWLDTLYPHPLAFLDRWLGT